MSTDQVNVNILGDILSAMDTTPAPGTPVALPSYPVMPMAAIKEEDLYSYSSGSPSSSVVEIEAEEALVGSIINVEVESPRRKEGVVLAAPGSSTSLGGVSAPPPTTPSTSTGGVESPKPPAETQTSDKVRFLGP